MPPVSALRPLLALALLNVFLLALEIPRHWGFGPNVLAFEALVLTGAFMLLPRHRWTRVAALVTAAALLVLTLMSAIDALARMSLSRPLNLYLDYPLITSVYDLAVGNLPPLLALGALAALVGALAILWAGSAALLAMLRPTGRAPAWRAGGAVLLVAGLAGVLTFHTAPAVPRAITPGVTLIADQAEWAVRTHRESRTFAAMLQADDDDRAQPLPGLRDTDVILGFIESYGVSAVFDDRYAPVIRPRLIDLERRVEAAGLHMVTGTLDAPMFGGQSWLAHASLLSGLWIENQLRYELMLNTQRDTLVQDFKATGHATMQIMPAITQDWPEGRWYGFDTTREAGDIPYHGPPFNWVTMPDQFTWWYFEQELRRAADAPVFAMLALVSSHAPWVPILPVIEDWERIGDGDIFQRWEGKGETPERLWRDHDRVRAHFALSVDYALNVAAGYAERYVDENTLLIVLGDHQPAQLITGPDPSPAAPVHVISGDAALLEPFRKRGFVAGGTPVTEQGLAGMDRLRSWLRADFGEPTQDD